MIDDMMGHMKSQYSEKFQSKDQFLWIQAMFLDLSPIPVFSYQEMYWKDFVE